MINRQNFKKFQLQPFVKAILTKNKDKISKYKYFYNYNHYPVQQ